MTKDRNFYRMQSNRDLLIYAEDLITVTNGGEGAELAVVLAERLKRAKYNAEDEED